MNVWQDIVKPLHNNWKILKRKRTIVAITRLLFIIYLSVKRGSWLYMSETRLDLGSRKRSEDVRSRRCVQIWSTCWSFSVDTWCASFTCANWRRWKSCLQVPATAVLYDSVLFTFTSPVMVFSCHCINSVSSTWLKWLWSGDDDIWSLFRWCRWLLYAFSFTFYIPCFFLDFYVNGYLQLTSRLLCAGCRWEQVCLGNF